MSGGEKFEKITLKDIAKISEDDFKKQLSAWIEERGVSRVLQSKLRADLFEHFNRTTLGRQMQLQHERAHQMVLSPLILVLNTLVADFLYTENCHFTLSVFATEVPHKNALPNFESTPRDEQFRFSSSELHDVFKAIGLSTASAKSIEEFYLDKDGSGGERHRKKSLLYSIFKTAIAGSQSTQNETSNTQRGHQQPEAHSDQSKMSSSTNCASCCRAKSRKFQVNSRYFKYLNRYLDILSERVREMSKSLASVYDRNSSKAIRESKDESTAHENSLKEKLNKITANLAQLSSSKRKSHKLREMLASIDRLSGSLEKCGSNLESILLLTSKCIESGAATESLNAEIGEQDVDYSTWLQKLRTSQHGKRFIERLETSLQSSVAKEEEFIEKMFSDKLENYRAQIRTHYKQKYSSSAKPDAASPPTKPATSIDREGANQANHLLANALNVRANEKEQYVDRIIESAKTRLKELEHESEKIDESFQVYLKRQKLEKNQLSKDLTRIWRDYNVEKSILDQHPAVASRPRVSYSTPLTIQVPASTPSKKSRANTDLLVCSTANAFGLDEALTVENPFKKLSISYLQVAHRNSTPAKDLPAELVVESKQLEMETVLETVSSSGSSYGNLPPNFNKKNEMQSSKHRNEAPNRNENAGEKAAISSEKTVKNREEAKNANDSAIEKHSPKSNIGKTDTKTEQSKLVNGDYIQVETQNELLQTMAQTSSGPLTTKTVNADSSTDEELANSLDISIGNKGSSSSPNEWI